MTKTLKVVLLLGVSICILILGFVGILVVLDVTSTAVAQETLLKGFAVIGIVCLVTIGISLILKLKPKR
ncbi:MAG: hypothetical protein UY09_C0007G0011 [Parcubacteria group bacterium GW2011_GWA2_47_8]|nr:MAG: hypothetical protein UY09_C0007G0011 [Parcubacteria group bacterium GW2011_GWA2_47_8]OHB19664.1 MAG: hypothetical protein A2666_03940 [Parcubacteria group bacterium RIFCSPHIGHO2_01_FULL_47_10b]